MQENMPPELFAAVFPILVGVVVYLYWIKPGYEKDRKCRSKRRK